MSSGKTYRAEVHQQRLALRGLTIAASIATIVSIFELLSAVGLAAFSLAVLSGCAAWLFPRRQRGAVEVRDGVLLFDQEAVLERNRIFLVASNPHAQNALVIWRKPQILHSRITIILESADDAKALVSDLQWDETQTAAEFWMQRGTYEERDVAFLKLALLAVLAVLGSAGLLFVFPSSWAAACFFIFSQIALTIWNYRNFYNVRVGGDGISMRIRLGSKRFIPYELITAVARKEQEICLHLKTGERVAMCLGKPNPRRTNSVRYIGEVSTVDALFERIENARSLFSNRAQIRSHLLSALKRDGRSLEAWRVAATSLSHEHYRVAATPRDVLENIVQDSAVAPDVRIGAAIALHADAGTRVRVATETSALPELGAAIDAALDGDDPALEKAIATLKLDA
jgi:hypothetical protein